MKKVATKIPVLFTLAIAYYFLVSFTFLPAAHKQAPKTFAPKAKTENHFKKTSNSLEAGLHEAETAIQVIKAGNSKSLKSFNGFLVYLSGNAILFHKSRFCNSISYNLPGIGFTGIDIIFPFHTFW